MSENYVKPKRKEDLLPLMENQRATTQPLIQTVTLMAIQDGIENLNRLIEATVGEGLLIPVGQVTISGLYEISVSNPNYNTLPWKGVQIWNDGPSAYYIAINEEYIRNPTPINQGEPFSADMGRDKIKKILLQPAVPGASSTLRIIAVK